MEEMAILGSSHVVRWNYAIEGRVLPAMPNTVLWGVGGIPLFSKTMKEKLERFFQTGYRLTLIVPDFRFGNNFFNDHQDFTQTGPWVDGYGMVHRNLITPDRDAVLYYNALAVLDHYAEVFGKKIQFVFWCLYIRERKNKVQNKYMTESGYQHPLWNFMDVQHRYRKNTIDLSVLDHFPLSALVVDPQGHPSDKTYVFLHHMMRGSASRAAIDRIDEQYQIAMEGVFSPLRDFQTSAKALQGGQKWLFLNNDTNRVLKQQTGTYKWSAEAVEAWGKVIAERKALCESRGIKQVMLVVPDKEAVYCEYAGLVPSERRPVRLLMEKLEEQGNEQALLYLYEEMLAHKSTFPLYDTIDTHWNSFGAYVGYRSLIRKMQTQGVACAELGPDRISFYTVAGFGDLGSKMNPPQSDLRLYADIAKPEAKEVYDNQFPNRGRVRIWMQANEELPTAVLFGDSFHAHLVPFLAESFRRLVFVHTSMLDKEWLDLEQPDVVIFEYVERFLVRVPEDFSAYSNSFFAETLLANNKSLAEKAVMLKATDPAAEALAAHYAGMAQLTLGELEEAQSLQQRALQAYPEWPSAHFFLGVTYFRQGFFTEARRHISQAYARGTDLLANEFTETNETLLMAAIQEQPDWGWPYLQLARLKHRQRHWEEALQFAKMAAARLPESAMAWYRLGCIAGINGLTEDAVACLAEASKRNPRWPMISYEIGRLLFKQEYFEKAEAAFRISLRTMPSRAAANFELGLSFLRQKKYYEAQKYFKYALEIAPEDYKMRLQLAIVQARAGNRAAAEASFQKALALNERYGAVYLEYAKFLLEDAKFSQAKSLLNTAFSLEPENKLIQALLRQVSNQEAIQKGI